MKFERIRVQGFGSLEGLDTGPDPLEDMVVILGRNESGKTTLFRFLGSLLYGFQPARAETHPYAPWSGAEIEGEARIRLSDGERVVVKRRLRSSPWGRVMNGGAVEDLRNRPLPFASHVSRPVFQQVYSLTLDEMAGLENATWGTIEDRLMATIVTEDVRSARVVAEELQEEAGRLWRPNRRGRQRVRELGEEIRELTAERRQAFERDRRLRDLDRQLAEARTALEAAREETQRLRRVASRLDVLLPAARTLQRIHTLEAQAGAASDLEGLPRDPEEALQHLREQAEEGTLRARDQEAVEAEWRERARGFTEQERRILSEERDIATRADQARRLPTLRAQHDQLEQEIRDLDRRAEAESRELFDDPLVRLAREELFRVPARELEDRVSRYESARNERRVREEAARMAESEARDRQSLPTAGILLAVVGAVLLVWGLVSGPWGLAVLGAVVVAGGLWAYRHLRMLTAIGEDGAVDVGVARARDLEGAALARVRESLAGLPVRQDVLENASLTLVGRLERLRELLGDHADRMDRTQRLGRDISAIEDRVRALGRRLGVEIPPDAANGAAFLERRLDRARHTRDEAQKAQRELARVARETERLRQRARAAVQRTRELESQIADLGRGSLSRGLERIRQRSEARAAAQRLRDELERTAGGPERLRRDIRAFESEEGVTVEAGALDRTRDLLERVGDRAQERAAAIERLAMEVTTLGRGDSAVDVDSRIESLREERTRLVRDRDRKALLASLISEADRRFREQHQPDVVRRAQEYVADVTGGRYDALVMTEDDAPRSLCLRRPDGPPVDVSGTLSRGTREQVYLALRLAVADHLDAGAETLPLFMDEVLVNWDRDRANRGLALLRRLSRERQVFVFTCHPPVADELGRSGAQILELQRAT